MRLTLPIISMVITFCSPAEVFSRPVEHPGQFWIGTYAVSQYWIGADRTANKTQGFLPAAYSG
jgi:hypothetical protein